MNTNEIKVLFWDNELNYSLPDTQVQLGIIDGKNVRYKEVFRFYSQVEFEATIKKINDNDKIIMLCHVDFKSSYAAYNKFEVFVEAYPNLRKEVIYVSSNKEAHKDFIDKQTQKIAILTYADINEKLRAESILPFKKIQIAKIEGANASVVNENTTDPTIKYAIITALYQDEFQEVEKLFNFEKDIRTGTTIYKIGKLKNTQIEVVACFATKTGMVEASIIATDMINKFNPDYIFMPGVCGGSEKTKFGSVIVAEKIFLFQKGKLSDLMEKKKNGNKKTKLLYGNSELDKNKITDSEGNIVKIIVEKFEPESEVIELDTEVKQIIEPMLKVIEDKINEPYKVESEKIEVQLEPMACSMMVINKEDYFDETILPLDRKTKAVEMESYGVARAAKIANGGKTKFLIFKSVMDKTKVKNDDYKGKAAYTSAQFLKYLLEENIL